MARPRGNCCCKRQQDRWTNCPTQQRQQPLCGLYLLLLWLLPLLLLLLELLLLQGF
jgi:hypothetical protein